LKQGAGAGRKCKGTSVATDIKGTLCGQPVVAAEIVSIGTTKLQKEICLMQESNGLPYFVTGVGVGLGIAMLFAPRSGSAMRKTVREGAARGHSYLTTSGAAIRGELASLVDKTAAALERQKQRIVRSVDAGKKTYYGTMENFPESRLDI
jgi:gas vesicle protein